MKKTRARTLRWQLAVPLAVVFGVLWLCASALILSNACARAEESAAQAREQARQARDEQWEIYQNNVANGLGDQAVSILRNNLSDATWGPLAEMDGGLAFLVRDSLGNVIRSQLAWGYGHEEGTDQGQRWYLTFDEGLDDQGQIALAQWIVDHPMGLGFTLYSPAEEEGEPGGDGTYARVTGLLRPGDTLSVQRIELIRPDGTVETMVETSTQGEDPVTVELRHLRVSSALLPYWWNSDGSTSPVDMELRLANLREVQAILDRELAGEERSVLYTGGFLSGTGDEYGIGRWTAGQYQALPYALRESWPLCLSLLLVTAAVLLLSARLSRRVTRPARELCVQTEAGRCREDGPVAELNTLAAAFNAAQAQLAGQLERERAFTRAAAHELKTPLAVLRTHAEALREDIDPGKREQYLDVVLDESDRMARLVSRLLELSRLESGLSLRRERLELSALVRAVWSPLELQLEQKGITLSLGLEEVWLEGDKDRLREAADNLASNAVRHCPSGGSIRVELRQEGDLVRLTVYNDGLPIPEEDLPHLWEPFWRGDRSRTRESGGTGLGLAIVRAAALAHGGGCGAENRPGGVDFWFSLPLCRTGEEDHNEPGI